MYVDLRNKELFYLHLLYSNFVYRYLFIYLAYVYVVGCRKSVKKYGNNDLRWLPNKRLQHIILINN